MKHHFSLSITLLLLLPITVLAASSIDWNVTSPAATDGSTSNLRLTGTAGQTAVGFGGSGTLNLSQGFWQDFGQGSPDYVCGDADGSGAVDIDDVVHLITYIFASGPAPDPYEAGDPNCSGGIDIDDVVYLILYIFGGGNAPCDTSGSGVPSC